MFWGYPWLEIHRLAKPTDFSIRNHFQRRGLNGKSSVLSNVTV